MGNSALEAKQREREQVDGFTRSEAHKAVWAEKRVAKEQEERYNKAVTDAREQMAQMPLQINRGNQNKHDPTRKSYIEGRSVFYGTVEDAQALVDRYHGMEEIRLDKNLKWIKKEFVNANDIIGKVYSNDTGVFVETNRFAIHYGKSGTHIVPRKPERKD